MTLTHPTLLENGYRIAGGNPLSGTVEALGAKNSVTKCLVASLLTDQPCRFTEVPNIQEVEVTIEMLESVGSQIIWNKEDHTIDICTPQITSTCVASRFSAANRIPILLLGALLGRTKEPIRIPSVGGCKIGARPVNFHLDALKTLGTSISKEKEDENIIYTAYAPKGLQGGHIALEYPSLGASENALLAASWAEGTSTISNISLEPEFIDLIHFLQKMGVIITFIQDRTIRVQKGARRGVCHTLIPDRTYAASFAMLAYATKGDIFVKGARQDHLGSFLSVLQQLKAPFEIEKEGIRFFYKEPLVGNIELETGPYPNFLTDMQQPLVTLLTQCKGIHSVHETVYEQRFGYTKTLIEMGAHIQLTTDCGGQIPCRFEGKGFFHHAMISGPTPLVGKEIQIPDLRAGFAYVIAALTAEGSSTLENIHYLKRGYGDLISPLKKIGALINGYQSN
ncbi:MAG: UDP-N-acetylglucosamine 1-carboxyvinyltransferase [Chlamydiia bacterium]